jgi:hypothetical protein
MAWSGESQPALGSFPATGHASFHKAKDSAPAHSIESKDNLVSIEDGDEPVHCTRGVMWAWRDVFSEDAPGILHSSQYRVLIRGVHDTRLTVDFAFALGRKCPLGGPQPKGFASRRIPGLAVKFAECVEDLVNSHRRFHRALEGQGTKR